jgi:hypothetical protein
VCDDGCSGDVDKEEFCAWFRKMDQNDLQALEGAEMSFLAP